jgi:hypothetical protein
MKQLVLLFFAFFVTLHDPAKAIDDSGPNSRPPLGIKLPGRPPANRPGHRPIPRTRTAFSPKNDNVVSLGTDGPPRLSAITSFVFPKPLPIRTLLGPDPIRFRMQANKPRVADGEEFELTITAELMPILPSQLFFFEAQRSFSLKLLLPDGFVQTGGSYYDYVGETLSNNGKTTVTYTLRGHFIRDKQPAPFILLRGPATANSMSLFEKKAEYLIDLTAPRSSSTAQSRLTADSTCQSLRKPVDIRYSQVGKGKNTYAIHIYVIDSVGINTAPFYQYSLDSVSFSSTNSFHLTNLTGRVFIRDSLSPECVLSIPYRLDTTNVLLGGGTTNSNPGDCNLANDISISPLESTICAQSPFKITNSQMRTSASSSVLLTAYFCDSGQAIDWYRVGSGRIQSSNNNTLQVWQEGTYYVQCYSIECTTRFERSQLDARVTESCGVDPPCDANWANVGTPYCSGGRRWQNQLDITPCSATYNQPRALDLGTCGCQGPNWVDEGNPYCSGGHRWQNKRDINNCSETANQTRTDDLGTCGCQGPNWVDEGAAYCGDNGHRYQPKRDGNNCSFTYNLTRDEDLGFTCDCKATPVTPLVRVAPNSFDALTNYTICEDTYVAFGMDRNPAGYTLQWTGPTNAQGPVNGNWEINNLLSSQQGIYTYTVTDLTNGCSSSAQVNIAVNPANYLGTMDETSCKLISGWLVDLNCQDRSNQVRILVDGQLVATVTADGIRDDVKQAILGRTTGYNQYGYRWTVPEYLRQGVHNVVVTDIKGNPLNNAQGRGFGIAPPITFVVANDSSYAYRSSATVCAGSFVALGRDRFPPDYSMRWQGPNGQQGPANQDWYLYHISPTQAGSYTYTVTDAYGCTNASTVNITVSPANYAKSFDELSCTQAAGWVVNTGCSEKATQLLIYADNVLVDSLFTDVARPDARLAVLGNTNGFNLYGFRWSIPASLKQGIHAITIKDNQGNILFGPQSYGIAPPITFVVANDSSYAYRSSATVCAGSFVALGRDRFPPDYSMRWQGPNGQQGPANQDWYLYHINPTQAGSYTYTVTDAYGCTNASTVNITVNPANYAKSLDELNCSRLAGWIVNTTCSDKATQLLVYINNTLVDSLVTDVARPDARQAVLGNTNGFNLYGFQWTIPENWRIGVYSMTVKDNQGTILFGPATYSIPASPTVHVTSSGLTSLSICPNSSFSLTAEGCPTPINWYTKDATGGLTYRTTVSPGSPASFSTATTTSYVARCHGYSVGCPDSDDSQTITVYIQSNLPTDPTFNGSFTPSICQGTSVTFASSCPSGQVKWVRYDTPGGSQIGYAIQDQLPLGGENPAGEYYMSVECVGTSCAGPVRPFIFTVIPKPVFGFAAAGSSPASYSANTTGPVTNQVTICSGGMLTFSGLTLSQPNIGLIEKSFSSGNVILGGVVLPADRPQNRISPSQMAQGFNQNYGPYATTDATVGTIEQWYTPYMDANNNDQYDEGECLGDRITLQYRILPLAKPTSVSASPAFISSPRSVTLNASGCANQTRWEWPTGTYTGATLVTTVNQTTTFGVRCVTETGCQSDSLAITVWYLNLPAPMISVSKLSICGNESVTLTATGCSPGSIPIWSNGLTGSPVSFIPTASATYYAFCRKDGATSEPSQLVTISVNPLPTISGQTSLTTGQTLSLTATAGADRPGFPTFSWHGPSGSIFSGPVVQRIGMSPLMGGYYTAVATYGSGCITSATVLVTVDGPTLQTQPLSQSLVCPGGSLSVPFSTSGSFNADNVFTVQLAQPASMFIASLTLVSNTQSSPLTVTLPANVPAGMYWLRVVSSSPLAESSQSPTSLTVTPPHPIGQQQ